MDKEAYVFIAYGEKYIKQVLNLLKSIKLFDKKRKCILISNEEINIFDETIDISNEFINESNSHNKYCVIARIMTPKYINYERFLMIDTDILCFNDPETVWDIFKKTEKCFACVGGRDGSSWHWGHIDEVNNKLNMALLPMHGGIIYFDKTKENYNKYFENLLHSLKNYDDLGFKRLFRNDAMTDEIIFSYANAKNSIIPLDFIDYPIVSFTLKEDIGIKENIVSWGTEKTTSKSKHPCIFNHFTGLNDSNGYNKLYQDWIEKINNFYIELDNRVSVITALFDIGRGENGDGRTVDNYIEWFNRTLLLRVPMIVYCDENIYDRIGEVRSKFPMTRFIILRLDEIYYLKNYRERVYDIVNNREYLNKIMGKDRLEIKLPTYNLLIMNKFIWLDEVAKNNYFNSDLFIWVDAGASRFFEDFDLNEKWPNLNKLEKDKLNIQVKKSLFEEMDIQKMIYHCDHFTTATIFGGGKEIIHRIRNEVDEVFRYMILKDCINNEQIVMGIIYKKYPELFNIFVNNTDKHLPYFRYLIY